MNLTTESTCDYCNEVDTIEHRFVLCESVKTYWQQFELWWNIIPQQSHIIKLTAENVLFGFYMMDNYSLNNCILVAKNVIHCQKCKKQPIDFNIFKQTIKRKIDLEKYILTRNKKLDVYDKRWADVERHHFSEHI